jgi:hypothetical protein
MNQIVKEMGVIAAGIIGLATIAVLVSRNAQTGNVISSAGRAFQGAISAAVSPVTGGGFGMGGGVNGFGGSAF